VTRARPARPGARSLLRPSRPRLSAPPLLQPSSARKMLAAAARAARGAATDAAPAAAAARGFASRRPKLNVLLQEVG